jgi:hypothetical protein
MPIATLTGGKRTRRARSRKNKGRSRKQRGGAGAAEYMVSKFGSDYDQQLDKVITTGTLGAPNAQQLALIQTAGGKRRRTKGQRSRKGGNIGAILSNAAPSLALFGLNYRYGRKLRSKKH